MIDDTEILARLSAYHDHVAVAPFEVADDVRRGRRRLRRTRALGVGGAAVATALVVVAGSLVGADRLIGEPPPVAPGHSPSTPGAWPGPLRTGLPLEPPSAPGRDAFPDPVDTSVGGIDIVGVSTSGTMRWQLALASAPEATDASSTRIYSYGVEVDGDGDLVADCEIGITDEPPRSSGVFRVWVTNLRTGATQEQVGARYGYPIDFAHPTEYLDETPAPLPAMTFFFLGKVQVCDPFESDGHFYTWTAMAQAGRVVAWDYAPDDAWLPL